MASMNRHIVSEVCQWLDEQSHTTPAGQGLCGPDWTFAERPTTIRAWTHVHKRFVQVEDVVKRNSVLSSQPQEFPLQVLLDGCDLIWR
eukprot:5463995-Amphidinium_carterae.1